MAINLIVILVMKYKLTILLIRSAQEIMLPSHLQAFPETYRYTQYTLLKDLAVYSVGSLYKYTTS